MITEYQHLTNVENAPTQRSSFDFKSGSEETQKRMIP